MTGYVTRTDGLSLCIDCANWSGPYSGCLIKTNNTTNCHVQICDSYRKKSNIDFNLTRNSNSSQVKS